MRFAEATAVRARPGSPGTYDAAVAPGWDIGGNANGGYLLSMAARAMADAAGRADPTTITAHYLAPAQPGPLAVATHVLKAGRRFTTVRAALLVEGELGAAPTPILAVLGTFTDRPAGGGPDGPSLVVAEPPELPPVEDCTRPMKGPVDGLPGFVSQIGMHLHPEDAGFASGAKSGSMRVRGWFSLAGDEPIDGIALLTAVDAFPPAIFNVDLPVAWVPTVELTAHVRARPAPGPLRCRFTTRFVSEGFLEEDGEVWDATGRMVAQSRQLALVPRPLT